MVSTAAGPTGHRIAQKWICPSCYYRQLKPLSNSFPSIPNSSKTKSYQPGRIQRRRSSLGWRRPFSTSAISLNAAKPPRNQKLPDFPARTRFAPSPTGYSHIGGLRTALFSYLLAKRTGGQFLLRIEDTDQKRLVPDAEERLCSDLQWAGLQWDEGLIIGGPYGPYRQSERTAIYQEHARRLLDERSAYRCFCSPQTASVEKGAYVTSSCYQSCSSLPPAESRLRAASGEEIFTVRLRHPQDAHKREYPDLVYGKIVRLQRSFNTSQTVSEDGDSTGLDAADAILVKSDGTPTYHFANVIDDHLMKITHVVRGSEWAASLPLHYDIYTAFGWEPPQFAHVGLLVDETQAKLSKRNMDLALDVKSMQTEQGILPQTLNNFLVLLGWSNPLQNDVMDMEELIRNFDLKFTRGNTIVKTGKLLYLQKQHVARLCAHAVEAKSIEPIKDIVAGITERAWKTYRPVLINRDLTGTAGTTPLRFRAALEIYCTHILLADSKAYLNAQNFVERNRYFFHYDRKDVSGEEVQNPNQKRPLRGKVHTEGLLGIRADLARTLEEDFDWRLGTGNEEESGVEELGERLHALERRLHAVLARQTWLMALQLPLCYLPIAETPVDLEFVAEYQFQAAWEQLKPASLYDPLTLGKDVERIARTLLGEDVAEIEAAAEAKGNFESKFEDLNQSKGERKEQEKEGERREKTPHEQKVFALVWRYKVCNAALMRDLRWCLSYGLPGPGMSVVMALLGKAEVVRRLGVRRAVVEEVEESDEEEEEEEEEDQRRLKEESYR